MRDTDEVVDEKPKYDLLSFLISLMYLLDPLSQSCHRVDAVPVIT
jgi:hypothetical protein